MAKHPATALLNKLNATGAEIRAHADSWVNVAMGFGTSRDKTMAGQFLPGARLQDVELASLFTYDHVAQKVVSLFPKEAFRVGYCLTGFDSDQLKEAGEFLAPYDISGVFTRAWIMSRCFGGGVLWPVTDDGQSLDMPLLNQPRNVTALRYFDRRFLQPYSFYPSGPNIGLPQTYSLFGLQGQQAIIAIIHETRLIRFDGALTEAFLKRELNGWDLSVLQIAYDALRSDGNVWKAIETLVSDANQGVFSVSNLWAMLSGKMGEELKVRVQMMDLTRSVARAILIDKDRESFDRKVTNFAGLADLDERSLKRVASASNYPYSLLAGEEPGGLNATGDNQIRRFYADVQSEQAQYAEPRLMRLLRMLLGTQASPLRSADMTKLGVRWYPLWSPSAKEKAEIEKLEAEADSIRIKDEVATPEEVGVSRMGGEEPGPLKINIEARQRILDLDEKQSKAGLDPYHTPEPDPNALPGEKDPKQLPPKDKTEPPA